MRMLLCVLHLALVLDVVLVLLEEDRLDLRLRDSSGRRILGVVQVEPDVGLRYALLLLR